MPCLGVAQVNILRRNIRPFFASESGKRYSANGSSMIALDKVKQEAWKMNVLAARRECPLDSPQSHAVLDFQSPNAPHGEKTNAYGRNVVWLWDLGTKKAR